ncbi:MAG: radical SAM protein [bacterium]|nr:radical SAM protein [bacterium]
MRVFLLNPPYKKNYIRSARSTWPSISGSNWYPIFLSYAAGWLEKHGHNIKLVDALVSNTSVQGLLEIAKDFKPELLVLYVSTQSLTNDLAIGEKIKKLTSCQVVLVGPWCAILPKNLLLKHKFIDSVARREFDDIVLDLANGKNKKDIKGILYRNKDKVVENQEREFLTPKQLDEFPYVTKIYKEHLEISDYHQASLLHPYVDLFTARGCSWNRCTFCLWPNTIHKGAAYRVRSLESVVEEFKFIQKELPEIKEIFIQDDTLPASRARALSALLLKKKIKIAWSCYARADMDLETLKIMKKAGCRYLHVGYESIDEKILENICKGTKPSQMKEFTENTKKAGLRVHGDFIIGLPGETKETIKKTLKWAKDLKIEGYQFFIPQPQEGTPLWTLLKRKGYLDKKENISYPYLTFKELNESRFKAMREIYFTKNYIFNTIKNIESMDDFLRLARTGLHVIPSIIKK